MSNSDNNNFLNTTLTAVSLGALGLTGMFAKAGQSEAAVVSATASVVAVTFRLGRMAQQHFRR